MTKLSAQSLDLESAVSRLAEVLSLEPSDIIRDSAIQRFEFTIELAWKTLKSAAEAKNLLVNNPRDAIRTAAQLELISDPETWLKALDARNLTSHTYDVNIADKVYPQIKSFLPLAQDLLLKLKSEIS
jgi:nucleotidyltransferase substrate binding protein (TIGR01987 family)